MSNLRAHIAVTFVGSLVLGALALGCGSSANVLYKDGGNGTGTGGYDGSLVGTEGGGKVPIGMTKCSDGLDNDGDHLIDSADPECTGPADDDEGTYANGIKDTFWIEL